jgi:hypothetical protein
VYIWVLLQTKESAGEIRLITTHETFKRFIYNCNNKSTFKVLNIEIHDKALVGSWISKVIFSRLEFIRHLKLKTTNGSDQNGG